MLSKQQMLFHAESWHIRLFYYISLFSMLNMFHIFLGIYVVLSFVLCTLVLIIRKFIPYF